MYCILTEAAAGDTVMRRRVLTYCTELVAGISDVMSATRCGLTKLYRLESMDYLQHKVIISEEVPSRGKRNDTLVEDVEARAHQPACMQTTLAYNLANRNPKIVEDIRVVQIRCWKR